MGRIIKRVAAFSTVSPGERLRILAKEFDNIMTDTRFTLWKPGNQISNIGTRWLIGVAVWSNYDWDLLNRLDEHLTSTSNISNKEVIDVFDVDAAFHEYGGFDEHISDLKYLHHTPLVGRWEDGVLIDKGSGYAGRKLVIDSYGLTLKSLGG